MGVLLNPYLNFRGQAREALEFYKSVFGGELDISTFADIPMEGQSAHETVPDQIMHGMLRGEHGVVLMAADAPPGMDAPPSTTAISLSGDDDAVLRGWWDGLSDGATDVMPLNVAPWGDAFGMLTDKFGIPWMVNIAGTPPTE